MQFYGVPQIANTVAPRMGATIWISDQPPAQQPVRAKIGGTAGGGASTTSTATTATRVTGTTITISGGVPQPELPSGSVGRRIKAAYGIVTSGTIVASDTITGWFEISAAELGATIRWNMEPVQGFLGATGQAWNIVSKIEGLDIVCQTNTTLQTTLVMDVAPANAANFAVGIVYQ
jgi:hypothetical protein